MIPCPCNGCKKRTIEPNCHNPARCKEWEGYCDANALERKARQEAEMLNRGNNLKQVKSKTCLGWAYELGDVRGRQRAESKKTRIPGGESAYVQR